MQKSAMVSVILVFILSFVSTRIIARRTSPLIGIVSGFSIAVLSWLVASKLLEGFPGTSS